MASVLGLELHHPIMSMLWGHGGRSKINKIKYFFLLWPLIKHHPVLKYLNQGLLLTGYVLPQWYHTSCQYIPKIDHVIQQPHITPLQESHGPLPWTFPVSHMYHGSCKYHITILKIHIRVSHQGLPDLLVELYLHHPSQHRPCKIY